MEHTRRLGDYEVDLRLFQLRRGGEVIPVERRVFDLIAYLLENCDRVVSNDELLRVLWNGRKVSKGSLTVAVAAARKALRDDATRAQVIITHRCRGYRIDAGRERDASALEDEGPGAHSFVGREIELATLGRLVEEAGSGRRRFASVFGEPGIGKSRLLEEFASVCRGTGVAVVFGRCREEAGGAPSFWPWAQVASQFCKAELAGGRKRVLAEEAPEIAALIAEPGFPIAPHPLGLAPADARSRLFDGFVRFLRRAAEDRAFVVILDDLHRADLSSLLLLEFALGEMQHAGLVVVVAYRPLELEADRGRSDVVARVARCTPGVALELEGLDREAIARWIRHGTGCTPTPEQTRSVGELTNGNPFLVSQLLPFLGRTLGQDGSASRVLP